MIFGHALGYQNRVRGQQGSNMILSDFAEMMDGCFIRGVPRRCFPEPLHGLLKEFHRHLVCFPRQEEGKSIPVQVIRGQSIFLTELDRDKCLSKKRYDPRVPMHFRFLSRRGRRSHYHTSATHCLWSQNAVDGHCSGS